MSAFPSTSFTDQVFTFLPPAMPNDTTDPEELSELRIAASSLLMDGFYSGRVLAGRNVSDIVAVQDELGRAILFSVSTERRLFAVVSPRGDRDDREEYDLTAGLPAEARVVAFGAGQSNQGDIYLAIAVESGQRVELRISRRLSNKVGATRWDEVGAQWIARGAREGGTVTRILVGNEPVRSGAAPLIVLVTRDAGDARYFEGDSNFDAAPAPWKPLSLPENAGEVADIVVGRNRRGDGVYTLLEKSGSRRLFFVPQNPQAPTPELPIPAGLARQGALGVLSSGPRGETDLFLAGDGAFVLPWDRQRTGATPDDLVTLADAKVASGLRNVLVCDDEESISVWAIDGGQELLFVPGSRPAPRTTMVLPTGEELEALAAAEGDEAPAAAEPVKWGAAVPGFRSGVRMIAPLRNRLKQANSLIALDRGSDVQQLFETSDGAAWSAKPIPVSDDAGTQEFKCYATTLNVTDPNGAAAAKPPALEITASERTEVLIDGVLYDIDERTPVRVTPDPSGMVTIMNRVQSTASPILRVASAGRVVAAVDPAAKVRAALARVDGAEALRAARQADGTPVFPNLDEETLESAAAGFKSLRAIEDKLPADGSRSRSYLSEADLSSGQPAWFGMASDGEAVRNVGRKAWEFIVAQVDRAWEFGIKLGERAYRFTLDCLAQVGSVVDWLLQNVLRAPFDALAKWLGFVFSWEDIVVTHNVLTNVATQVLVKAEAAAVDFSGQVEGFFNVLIGEVKKLKPLDDARAGGGVRDSGARMRSDLGGGLKPEDKRRFGEAEGFDTSPAGTFASFHCRHSLRGTSSDSLGVLTAEESGALEQLRAVLTDLWTKAGGSLTKLIEDLVEVFRNGKLTLNEIIVRIAGSTTIAVLELIRNAAVTVAKVAGALIRLIREKLTQPLEVPFLSFLYKKFVGREMSALGGFMLLLAVPATSLYKILTGEAPFPLEPAVSADGEVDASAGKNPRTYGLDTLIGAAFWSVLAGTGGVIAGAFFALYKCVAVVKQFADSAYKTLEGAYQAIGTLIGIGMALLKLVIFMGNALWLSVGTPLRWQVPGDIVIVGRFMVSVIPVAAAFLAVLDPTNATSAAGRIVAALLDLLLAAIWCGIRMYHHITESKAWLVAMDVAEVLTNCLGNLASISGGAGTLSPEGVSKTVLIGAGYALTALWLPAAAINTAIVPYIPMSDLVFPIA